MKKSKAWIDPRRLNNVQKFLIIMGIFGITMIVLFAMPGTPSHIKTISITPEPTITNPAEIAANNFIEKAAAIESQNITLILTSEVGK